MGLFATCSMMILSITASNIIMLSVALLNVVKLNVVMLNVIILSVVAPKVGPILLYLLQF